MGEEELRLYIPAYGDRIAVIDFARRSKISNSKEGLVAKLRKRLIKKRRKGTYILPITTYNYKSFILYSFVHIQLHYVLKCEIEFRSLLLIISCGIKVDTRYILNIFTLYAIFASVFIHVYVFIAGKHNKSSESSDTDKEVKRSCTSNATKETRLISIGWLNYDFQKKKYKQVRCNQGGGTRHLSVKRMLLRLSSCLKL